MSEPLALHALDGGVELLGRPTRTAALGAAAVLGRLAAEQAAIVDDICDAAARTVPAVAALRSTPYWFLGVHAARRVVRLFLRPLDEPPLCAEDVTWLRRYGSRASEYGFSADDFAVAAALGVDVTLQHIGRACLADIPGSAVADMARRLNLVRDMVVQNFRAGERGETGDPATAFFQDVLRGTGRNDARLLALAPRIGLDLARPFALLLLALESHDEAEQAGTVHNALRQAVAALRGAVLLPPPRGTASHSLLVVPVSECSPVPASRWQDVVGTGERLVERLGRPVLLARPVTGIDALRESYASARRLLPLATRLLDCGAPRVLSVEELRLHSLLLSSAPSEQDRFVEEMLGPLLRLPEAQQVPLLRALDVLCVTHRLPDAARLLHVHANTVKYRREKLEELCGRSLAGGEDRLNMWLALRLAHVLGRIPAGALRRGEAG